MLAYLQTDSQLISMQYLLWVFDDKSISKNKRESWPNVTFPPKVARSASTPRADDGYNSFHQHNSTSYIETLPNDITQYQNII